MNEAERHEYEALTAGAGLADFRGHTLIELTGRDRATFLHNFCTNDIRGMKPLDTREAFITSVQGKILGHVLVFCGEDSLVLETVPGQAEKLIAHLDRYLIREDVALHDRSEAWGELLLAGPRSPSIVTRIAARLGGLDVDVRRVGLAGPEGFLIRCAAADFAAVEADLLAAVAVPCSAAAVEVARIEAGWPLYGQDITDENLPQEVARDKQAISFVKGCYLGQETVARIDALGHVNRTLCGLRFEGADVPAAGTPLTADDRPAGHVTSAVFSPRLGTPLALGYVRRGHEKPGSKLQSPGGAVEVIHLPL